MALPENFKFTEPHHGTPSFFIAHNLRSLFNVTVTQIDADLRARSGGGGTIFMHRFTEMFDLESAQRAYAMTYEQAKAWCSQHDTTVEALLTKEALTDENRRHVRAMVQLGVGCLEQFPPTPEDHNFLGPVSLPLTGLIYDAPADDNR